VDDLLEGMIRMMQTGDDVIGPINLGNPREFTIMELAEMILKMTGSGSRIVHLPLPQDDPVQRKPIISRAKAQLNDWEPLVGLEEGLERTIAYFNKLLKV
jgi:UDP-glucuronate decarboxylase